MLGKQDGRKLEIVNSIELEFKVEGNKIVVDEKYAEGRIK